jgi:hypothetical protein
MMFMAALAVAILALVALLRLEERPLTGPAEDSPAKVPPPAPAE